MQCTPTGSKIPCRKRLESSAQRRIPVRVYRGDEYQTEPALPSLTSEWMRAAPHIVAQADRLA